MKKYSSDCDFVRMLPTCQETENWVFFFSVPREVPLFSGPYGWAMKEKQATPYPLPHTFI